MKYRHPSFIGWPHPSITAPNHTLTSTHLSPPCYGKPPQALRWGPEGESDVAALQQQRQQQPYHLIVGADLIYYTYCAATPHSRLLLWTLQRIVTPGVTVVYLALSLHHNPEVGASAWMAPGEAGIVRATLGAARIL